MASNKNIPDRIKLVVQLVVFTLGTWLLLILILMFSGVLAMLPKDVDCGAVLYGLLPVSLVIQVIRFVYRWKELVQAERSGQFPDLENINNMTLFQSVFVLIGILLLVSGVFLFALYSKLAGVLCLMTYLVLWGYDVIYLKKRMQKIQSDHASNPSRSV